VRRRLVGASLAIVAVALVALPGAVGSRVPAEAVAIDAARLQPVQARVSRAAAPAVALDPGLVSAAALNGADPIADPGAVPWPVARAVVPAVAAPAGVIVVPAWRVDPEISWYGPGFYGNRTACGHAYTQTIMGVAHKTLPCGTLVTFKHGSRIVTVPVIDRGPYVPGRIFDLSAAACRALDHCYTGPIQYRFP
jgi:hypothetical protein